VNVPCWGQQQQGTGQVLEELAAGNAAEQAEEERRTTDAEAAAGSDAAAATTDAGKSYEGGLQHLVCVLGILNPHCKGGGGHS